MPVEAVEVKLRFITQNGGRTRAEEDNSVVITRNGGRTRVEEANIRITRGLLKLEVRVGMLELCSWGDC